MTGSLKCAPLGWHVLEQAPLEAPPCPGPPRCFPLPQQPQDPPAQKGSAPTTKVRRTMSSRVHEAVKAIALCHNVTPVYESNGVTDQAEAEKQYEDSCRVYQASSPDEVSPAHARRPARCAAAPGGAACRGGGSPVDAGSLKAPPFLRKEQSCS